MTQHISCYNFSICIMFQLKYVYRGNYKNCRIPQRTLNHNHMLSVYVLPNTQQITILITLVSIKKNRRKIKRYVFVYS